MCKRKPHPQKPLFSNDPIEDSPRIGSSDFLRIQKKWYRRLKKEGFMDIEDHGRSDRPLKVWDSLYFLMPGVSIRIQSTQEYYEWTKEILETHDFKTPSHEAIWMMHSEGFTMTEISNSLTRLQGMRQYTRSGVRDIIQSIKRRIKNG
jgi:hypothetical protein